MRQYIKIIWSVFVGAGAGDSLETDPRVIVFKVFFVCAYFNEVWVQLKFLIKGSWCCVYCTNYNIVEEKNKFEWLFHYEKPCIDSMLNFTLLQQTGPPCSEDMEERHHCLKPYNFLITAGTLLCPMLGRQLRCRHCRRAFHHFLSMDRVCFVFLSLHISERVCLFVCKVFF